MLIAGWDSKISEEVRSRLNEKCERWDDKFVTVERHDRFLFAQGMLVGKGFLDMSTGEMSETINANMLGLMSRVETVLEHQPNARICIIGSESGIVGSYDKLYAATKAAIHQYIETRRVGPNQQLVGIAPNVISDAGMTVRRTDRDRLEDRRERHPLQRFCTSAEVAELIMFLLYVDRGYINNTVIRMNGGEHSR